MHNTEYIGGQLFHYGQRPAVAGHSLPGYLVKWGQQQFTFFDEREEMENWFTQTREACLFAERRRAFKPLEVVYEGQRCGFYADIECYTPTDMPPADVDTLKAAIMRHVNDAYFSAGFDSTALLWSENHRGHKVSFHVEGRDVDFEGTHPHSDLAHVAKKLNWDCLELTREYPLVDFSECGRTGKKVNLFDLKVCSKNRAMRTIFSSKDGSEDSCFKPCAGFEGRELNEWWIVRDRGSTRRVHTEPWDHKLEKLSNVRGAKMTVKTYNPKAFKIHIQTSSKCEEANDTQKKVAQKLQAYFQQEQEDPTITVKYDGEYARDGGQPADSYRLDGKHRNCATCSGGPHESNGAGEENNS
eukprot:g6338.t1